MYGSLIFSGIVQKAVLDHMTVRCALGGQKCHGCHGATVTREPYVYHS